MLLEVPDSPHTQIADVQNRKDHRALAIQQVGIKDIRHPILLPTRQGEAQPSIATFMMTVGLPATVKGTHMSRFVELLHQLKEPITVRRFQQLLDTMITHLEVERGYVTMDSTFFIEKTAPVSGVKSFLDYQISLMGTLTPTASYVDLRIVVPVTSLCPCSKEISAYGAHNQRSHVTATVRVTDNYPLESLIEQVEAQASCELYGQLKRSDEKYVTEQAYDNPKFVEDIVRDIAQQFNKDDHILGYSVESENFESIHNHSAYAKIEKHAEFTAS